MNNKNKKIPHWIDNLIEVISEKWEYKCSCNHFNCKALYNHRMKIWEIYIAPVFQEIYGGNKDGLQTWSPFVFDAGEFAQNSGVVVENCAVASFGFGNEKLSLPHMMIKGRICKKNRDHKFFLRVMLEPAKETKAVEILDTYQKKIREVKKRNT